MLPEIVRSRVYGCHDRNLHDCFRVVMYVLGETNERLSTPEYEVCVYDRRDPSGMFAWLPLFAFLHDYVRALTSAQRDRRLVALKAGRSSS